MQHSNDAPARTRWSVAGLICAVHGITLLAVIDLPPLLRAEDPDLERLVVPS
ncbi:MAG: hypothetical protein ABJD97_14280 [Betaproteobacteria bacterium]